MITVREMVKVLMNEPDMDAAVVVRVLAYNGEEVGEPQFKDVPVKRVEMGGRVIIREMDLEDTPWTDE